MKNPVYRWWAPIAAAALLMTFGIGGAAVVGADAVSGSVPQAEVKTATVQSVEVDRLLLPGHDEDWRTIALRKLEADATLDQSIYLSLHQLVEISRKRGKLRESMALLETTANQASRQPLKNAVRRLLVDVCLELGYEREAEQHLNTIISESLLQQ